MRNPFSSKPQQTSPPFQRYLTKPMVFLLRSEVVSSIHQNDQPMLTQVYGDLFLFSIQYLIQILLQISYIYFTPRHQIKHVAVLGTGEFVAKTMNPGVVGIDQEITGTRQRPLRFSTNNALQVRFVI